MIEFFAPISVADTSGGYGLAPTPGIQAASITEVSSILSVGAMAYARRPTTIQQLQGQQIAAFGGDLYEKIHVSAALLALGNVIGLQERTVNVWNAYTRAQILAAIELQNAEGITVLGPAAPRQFGPLEEQTYTVRVATSGPATVDASIVFDFGPYDLTIAVTGSRVTAWSFIPDWSRGILERIDWKSDVLQSYDGSEQRGALRLGPRKSWEFEAFFEGKARRYAESLIWGWGARTWALPVWPDGQGLAAPLAAGSNVVPLSTATRDFRAGGLVVILGDAFTFEVAEVDSVFADRIQLKRQTAGAWPQGAMVYPARLAQIMDRVTADRWSGDASGLRVSFDVVEPCDYTASAGAASYRGRPVLELRPEWSGGYDLELTRKLAELDNITGGRAFEDEAGIPATRQRMRFAATTRAEGDTLRRLAYFLQGRVKSAWVPTWTDDFKLSALVAPGAAGIDVEWTGYTQQIGRDVGRRDIRIELRSGSIFYRRIEGSQEVSQNVERLALDSALPVQIAPDDVLQISFLSLARQDVDAVEFAHWTGDSFDVATVFRSFTNVV